MKKLLFLLLSLGLVLLCIGCDSGSGADEDSFDDFDQAAWEVGVTENVTYANFTTGTWWFRRMYEDYEGNKSYKTGEFVVTVDIIDSDDGHNEYLENLTYTKIILFDEKGSYSEYTQDELDRDNSYSFKLKFLNRISGGTIDKTQEKWQKAIKITANSEGTKFKSSAEEWHKSTGNPWGIARTTYFFEKIK